MSESADLSCPHLGLANDPGLSCLYPTSAHRCYRNRTAKRIDWDHQEFVCLKGTFRDCADEGRGTAKAAVTQHSSEAAERLAQTVRSDSGALALVDPPPTRGVTCDQPDSPSIVEALAAGESTPPVVKSEETADGGLPDSAAGGASAVHELAPVEAPGEVRDAGSATAAAGESPVDELAPAIGAPEGAGGRHGRKFETAVTLILSVAVILVAGVWWSTGRGVPVGTVSNATALPQNMGLAPATAAAKPLATTGATPVGGSAPSSPPTPTRLPSAPTAQVTGQPGTSGPTLANSTATRPASTPTRAVRPAQAGQQVHVVSAGETLSLLSAKYNVTIDALMRVNGLTNKDFIYSGQRLIVP